MGGGSPLTPKEVQGSLCTLAASLASVSAQVLTQPVLPVGLAPRHVSPHVDVEDIAAGDVGHVELLLVAKGIALDPEEVQELREAGMVLVKKEL